MKKLLILAITTTIALTILMLIQTSKSSPTLSDNLIGQDYHFTRVGWIPYWDQARAVKSFYDHVDVFDYIGLFWYTLDEKGTIVPYQSAQLDADIVVFAHQHNVGVLALVANLPDSNDDKDDWDWQRVDTVISNPQKRAEHIQKLIDLVEKNNFDGLAIDYEALEEKQRASFSTFIEELSTALHQINKVLSVAIHPLTSERNPREDNGSRAQDLSRIFKAADQLHLMTYGEHDENTEPGANASLKWTTDVLKYVFNNKNTIREKIYLGVPLDATMWNNNDGGEGLVYTDVQTLIDTYAPSVKWDSIIGEPNFNFQSADGANLTVWFTNRQSVEQKTNLAQKHRVGGLSFWRLGGEDTTIWEIFK